MNDHEKCINRINRKTQWKIDIETDLCLLQSSQLMNP